MNKIISLNLLPPTEKKEAAAKRNLMFVRNALIVLLLLTIFSTLLVWSSNVILEKQLAQTLEQVSLVNANVVESRQKIAQSNKLLNQLDNIQKDHLPWSVVIWEIFEQIPPGISINQLSLDAQAKTLLLDGHAIYRENLLDLENAFNQEPLLHSVYIPLKNKLVKSDINFTLTAELNLGSENLYEK